MAASLFICYCNQQKKIIVCNLMHRYICFEEFYFNNCKIELNLKSIFYKNISIIQIYSVMKGLHFYYLVHYSEMVHAALFSFSIVFKFSIRPGKLAKDLLQQSKQEQINEAASICKQIYTKMNAHLLQSANFLVYSFGKRSFLIKSLC